MFSVSVMILARTSKRLRMLLSSGRMSLSTATRGRSSVSLNVIPCRMRYSRPTTVCRSRLSV
eukprot:2901523-Rhodomonas_salina.1